MHHIIYLSWATVPLTDKQLEHLLVVARQRNTKLAVTGVLFYGNERFMKVLEGEEETVRALYAQIRQDARHNNILTFADKPVAQRAFMEWSMAFQLLTPQQLQDVVGHLGATDTPMNTAGLSNTDTRLFDLLRSFVLPSQPH
jgi:uncharacterized protein YaaQ